MESRCENDALEQREDFMKRSLYLIVLLSVLLARPCRCWPVDSRNFLRFGAQFSENAR